METAANFRREIILWVVVAVSLLLFISNFGIGGTVGNGVSGFMFGILGLLAYLFPVLLLVGCFFAVSNKGNTIAAVKIAASILFVLFFCLLLTMIASGDTLMKPLEAYTYSRETKKGGGLFGGLLAYILLPAFGTIGTYIIDVIVLIICLVLITGHSAMKGMQKGGEKVYHSAKEHARLRMNRKVSGVSADTAIPKKKAGKDSDEISEISPKEKIELPKVSAETKVSLSSEQKPVRSVVPMISGNFSRDIPTDAEQPAPEPLRSEQPPVEQPGQAFAQEYEDEPAVKHRKSEKVSEEEMEREVGAVVQEIMTKEPVQNYVFPPLSLLKSGNSKRAGNSERQLRETAEKLEQTLKTFGVNVTVTNISCGPAVTRYEIRPEMGVKVSKIVGLADDIKLNLAAADIRIEAPIPGKAAVGIEVPNKENVTVPLRDLIESQEFKTAKSNISFAVGKDIAGKVKIADISKMPHLLIAGATGSGKSVCINTIIMSILYKADPNDVKLIMIDPKVVELSVYNGIPHLMIPVVTDPKKAAGALNWAVAEMTERYQKFAEANVRDINGYNEKLDKIDALEGQPKPGKMPRIVIIVDELADLMMVASGEVEEAICRLAQLARACGIHLIIATQRPSVNVITGLIKANMPSRIAFAVTSGVDSRTILDMVGAEKLLGKGDMLFYPQGIPKPLRVQGALVSDKEVSDVVAFLTEHNGNAQYSDDIQQKVDSHEASSNQTVSIADADSGSDGRDSYFTEAAKIIIDKDKASIGMLQRYLKVGFNRAARIMDQLEEAGIVGPEEGTKPRKVLMSPEELEQFIDEA